MHGSLEKLKDVLEFPFYLISRTPTGYTCDKLTEREKGLNRTRYFLNGNQCTCMSFVKTEQCKHLHMLKGNFAFVGEGADKDHVITEVNRLIDGLGSQFPDADWTVRDGELMEKTASIELKIPLSKTKGLVKVVSIKSLPKGVKLAIVFHVIKD